VSPLRLQLPGPVSGRIAVLDELKGVAILLVILYHAGGVLVWPDYLHGEVGVDIFIILSGMGLTLSTTRETDGRFLLRRFWRIYPAYWIALAACIVADGYFRGIHFGAGNILLHVLGIHGWFGDLYAISICDAFWFITLIVTLYVIYVPLRRLGDRVDLLVLAGSVISIVPILIYFYWGQSATYAHITLRIPGFFLGLLIGKLMRTGSLDFPLTAKTAGAFFLLFYVAYGHGIIIASFCIGLVVMFAYAFLLRPYVAERVRKDLKFLGDRSLEIFLIHQPLMREYNVLVLQRIYNTANLGAVVLCVGMAIGLAVTLVLASGLHRLLARIPFPGAGRSAPALA
jgi:peptidoglycan/LPS O-acetylase OafA/YrhL